MIESFEINNKRYVLCHTTANGNPFWLCRQLMDGVWQFIGKKVSSGHPTQKEVIGLFK